MSVPTYRRYESKAKFIQVAEELVECAKIYGKKLGKRHEWFGVQKVYDTSIELLNAVVMGNSYNPKQYNDVRQEYFKDALGRLDCLSVQISLLYKYATLTDNQWEHWGILLATERKLLNGIINYGKEHR